MQTDIVQAILDKLKTAGNRVTTQRLNIIRVLVEAEKTSGHITAEDLISSVQNTNPEMNISTIYRNLEELERLGIIEHVHFGHTPAMYHLTSTSHFHLVCERCGDTVEVGDDISAVLIETIKEHFEFVVKPHHFAIVGYCKKCSGDSDVDDGPTIGGLI